MSKSNVRRDAGLDALRASLTLLVLFHHTSITYGASGDWYYTEVHAGHDLSSLLLSLFTGFNQAFFMGLFFLLAGYFTPGAVERHGAPAYMRERVLRLGVPLIVYFLLLSPVTIALAATARGHDFFKALVYIWTHGLMEPGPLWFCEALLIFAGLYLAVRAFAPGLMRFTPPSFPSDTTLALAALGTGAAAFLLRLVWPTGTTLLHLQLGYFASYVVLFAAGCLAAPWPSLDEAPAPQRRLWVVIACVTFPLMPVAFVLGGHIAWLAGSQSGGWNLQAAVYAFWEPFLAWGVIMGLLHLYTRRFEAPGPVWRVAVASGLRDLHHPPARAGRSRALLALRRGAAGAQVPCDGDRDLPCVLSAGGPAAQGARGAAGSISFRANGGFPLRAISRRASSLRF